MHQREVIAEALGIKGDLRWRIRVEARRHGRVVICPHASVAYKEWPEDRWADVLEAFPGALVAAAPGREFLGQGWPTVILDELAKLLAGASCVVAVDSGPIHLADAIGVPVVGLYAATSVRTYGPYNDPSRCICKHREASDALGFDYDSSRHLREGEPMARIAADEVIERVRAHG